MKRQLELLELMEYYIGVEYISDLRRLRNSQKIRIILNLFANKFPENEVNDAKAYLEIE